MIDDGYWTVENRSKGGMLYLQSSDFTHDVMIQFKGDFASYDDQVKYAEELAERLNKDADKRYVPKL